MPGCGTLEPRPLVGAPRRRPWLTSSARRRATRRRQRGADGRFRGAAMVFRDRQDAGRRLAERLAAHAPDRPVVVGMARGGLPVAALVAQRLVAPLDVIVVRKIGLPWQPELGLGAIVEGGAATFNEALMAEVGVRRDELEEVVRRERAVLEERVQRYRGGRPPIPVEGRVAILVDDGLATGFTARAAIAALRARGASRVILAVPVAPLADRRGAAPRRRRGRRAGDALRVLCHRRVLRRLLADDR